jgi:hypothetical protein
MKSRLGRTPPANPGRRAHDARSSDIHAGNRPRRRRRWNSKEKDPDFRPLDDEFTEPSAKQAKAAKKRDVSLVQLIVNFRPAFRRS